MHLRSGLLRQTAFTVKGPTRGVGLNRIMKIARLGLKRDSVRLDSCQMGATMVSCGGPRRRREFLRAGLLALGGASLGDIVAARAAAGDRSDTSVILFWMWGGPSQLETWDPKPNAPIEYRGPFRPISSTVPGLDVCELFPRQAALGQRISLIRSLTHSMSSHNDGSIEVLTGKTPTVADPTSTAKSEHPDFGMIASRMLGASPKGLPRYVGIPQQPFMTRPTYLGLSHSAFATGDPSAETYQPRDLSLSAGINASRLDNRKELLAQFDRFQRAADVNGSLEGIGRFRETAFSMLTSRSVVDAFDLRREDPKLRDRYGRHLWGQSCLLARKLAEAGVSVITIDALAPSLNERYFSWDDHINVQTRWDLAGAMRHRARFMDEALSALITDIHERGLDRRILVVAMGEFGRTPRVVHADGLIGRDHWPSAMSALVSGGGLRMGQVIGATNSKAEYPAELPLTPQDLLATIYRHLGIAAETSFQNFAGRPVPILLDGRPIAGLV